jgi:serine/threonine protein phosphatase PrpC
MAVLTMRPAVLSEVGPRENNEDSAFVSPRLVAVADGVGGAASGEVASRLAIQKMIGLEKRRLERPLEQEFSDAVSDANAVIGFVTAYDPQHTGMATTLTAVALANDGSYLVANIGDSRTYLLRTQQLLRLTRDDSLIQELIDRGALSEPDARRHPQRSVVLQALDGFDRPRPPIQTIQARAKDRLLLCSDGVTDYVSDAQIGELLQTNDAVTAVNQIVHGALEQGARDNVTAIVVDVITRAHEHEGWLRSLPAGTESET